jgi:hypothetical protein
MPIEGAFQSILGRNPTADEQGYFQKFIDQGYLQPYEVGQILQSTPEYQQRLLQQQVPQLEKMYAANDERIMGLAGDALARRFAQQGRTVTGSGYTQAYMNSARDLAAQRQNQLASFYHGGLGQLRQMPYEQGQYALMNRGYGQRDVDRDWGRQLQMYEMQKRDYNDAMARQNRWNLQNSLIQTGVGLGMGAIGGGFGAMAAPAGMGMMGFARGFGASRGY